MHIAHGKGYLSNVTLVMFRGVCRINFGEVQTLNKLGLRGVTPSKTHCFWPFVNCIMLIFFNFLDFVHLFPSFFLIFV